MTSSFLCDNCGIKVAEAEGTECPGCGHIGSGTSNSSSSTSKASATTEKDGNFFSNLGGEKEWSMQHLKECDDLFNHDRPYEDQLDIINEVISRTKAKVLSAPNKESGCRLHAYLSEMYRVSADYVSAYDAAVIGVESTEQFFNHQSHNSILDSLFNLDKHTEFESWMERALADNFDGANFYKIRYLTKFDRFDEALEVCESHYRSDVMLLNSQRSEILIKAKRFDEAEQILRKLTANGPRAEFAANWINTLAFSILMPQGRYGEAERILISALCTHSEREKINAFSNLAMLAFNMNELQAAKRFAAIAEKHPDNPIASESRLTLCKIELTRLLENEDSPKFEWENFFLQVKRGLELSDFDDAPAFLELLVSAAEKAGLNDQIVPTIEKEFVRFKGLWKWNGNIPAREKIQALRVNILSERYLQDNNFFELDKLFTDVLNESQSQGFDGLLDYLRTPFAGIELRRTSLKISDKQFLASWASFEKVEEILFGLAKNSEEPILVALAENPYSAEPILEIISKRNDIDTDFALTNRENLSPKMISILSRSTFEGVRKIIAQRSDLDTEIFTALATDSAMLVRDAIRENQACPPEIRALAALGSL